jgi:O-acetyl-ADP-ribose deacetylase (regulator of RNase III)
MVETFLHGLVVVKVGDITLEKADAIVNAANATLLGGGGVDGAIHDRGGPAILAECRALREKDYPEGLPTGEAVITNGGKLLAQHVIHTVGPIYGQNAGRDAERLAACYLNSLKLAASHVLESIAFPSISTGVFGYPKQEAAVVASNAIKDFADSVSSVKEIRLVFFSDVDADVFLEHHLF